MVDRAGAQVRAAVVGTGLIGGSILLRLRDAGLDVAAWDLDTATRQEARRAGVCCPDRLVEAVADRDVVFLCGPLPTLPDTLLRVAKASGEGCVLTDVGSTKVTLAAFAAERGLGHRFVPGHPMAGTDRAGLTSATPALFDGAAWVLCPGPGAGVTPFRWLTTLIVAVFRARVVPMSAADHDAVVALSSHVPHLLAGALAGATSRSVLRDAILGLAAGSFRDGTRVAGAPPERTANMLLGNREHVLRELAVVRSFLDELTAALRDGDGAALVTHYLESRAARAALAGPQFTVSHQRFPVSDGEGERDFLLTLGAAGGYLTRCRLDGAVVEYTGHRPALEPGGPAFTPLG